MIMAMVQDIRVILIKLCRPHAQHAHPGSLRPDKRRRIARETLEIYSPLAHRLGIHHIKTELEELGFESAVSQPLSRHQRSRQKQRAATVKR